MTNKQTNQKKQEILTAIIKTYGTTVTRKNLMEFEQAGRGNCAFIGALYRSGRGTYQLPTVYDAMKAFSKEAEIERIDQLAQEKVRQSRQPFQNEYNRALNRAWEAMSPPLFRRA
ncbi:hypothetical protein CMI37_34345 [Candidatus Pacearchaeota archaeon]|nr:hypothetical protein [Candidatus Pacearchaeota archaeon]|tara:strand:+ start:340 stop:684 length:345 start_codon:yes stop_codon:yes gene_type:complete